MPRCIVKWNDIWEINDPPEDMKKLAMFWARQFEDECPKCDEPCPRISPPKAEDE